MNTLIKVEGHYYKETAVDKVYYTCIAEGKNPDNHIAKLNADSMTGYYFTIGGKAETDIEPFGIFNYLIKVTKQPELMRKIKELIP